MMSWTPRPVGFVGSGILTDAANKNLNEFVKKKKESLFRVQIRFTRRPSGPSIIDRDMRCITTY